MEKYNLLPEQLLYEGTVSESNFFEPEPLTIDWILKTHDQHYWEKLDQLALDRKEERRTGFPLSRQLVDREVIIMNGTLEAVHYAEAHGIAMNIAGGTHHAFTDRGEGFCLLNDMAISANYLLHSLKAKKILIIDLDVHQGNGTAQIFQNEPRVFTFSMHGASNYPMHKEYSDLDVPLPDKTDDKSYLSLLDRHLNQVVDTFQPDFLFYQSGVDVLDTDKLGRLGMSIPGCKRRDEMVLTLAHENDLPLVVSMGGGYSEKISHIVEAHANTYRLAQEIYF